MNRRLFSCEIVLLLIFMLSIAAACSPSSSQTPGTISHGHTYYVSKNGNNTDGKSWATAWNELNQINWSVVQPRDTILLDGGSHSMIYITTLTIGKSGTQIAPITIQRATNAGHNGHVILFGGRTTPLPYCGQSGYIYQPSSVDKGIVFNAYSWVVIDGRSWHGISIHGFNNFGIDMTEGGNPSNDTLRNLEIYDIGAAIQSGGVWSPDGGGEGVWLSGTKNTFEQMDIHDNGDDEFNSGTGGTNHGGAISNVTINRAWMHITREDPRTPGIPFNDCIHQDGYQIWDGGVSSGLLIENSILGPGLGENVILGQAKNAAIAGSPAAQVNNVTLQNNLLIGRARNILGYPQVLETGWVIDHDTVVTFGSGTGTAESLFLEGKGNNVTNSIFYKGQIYAPDGFTNPTGNCQWNTTGHTSAVGGQTVDPQFVTGVSSYTATTPLATLAHADFSLQPNSPCKGAGSSVTSIAQFLSVVDSQPSPS